MEDKEEKTLTKKDLKLKARETKLAEKQRKMEEKADIKAEKERRKNSFGRKIRNFFLTIILVIILVIVGFYFSKEYLTKKEKDLANEKMNQTYQTVLSLIENKDYKGAIDLLKTITNDFVNYDEVSKKLKEVEELYLNEYLVDADKYFKDKKFDRALEILNNIDEEFQDVEIIINKKSEIHIQKIRNEINDFENKKQNIMDIMKYLADYDTNELQNVKDEIDDLMKTYKNQFILETRELMKQNYEEAKTKVEEMEKILPDDKDIKELVEELTKIEPVSLLSLEEDDKDGRITISTNPNNDINDIDGNSYINYILVSNSKDDSNTVTYKLNKKYSKLTGKICVLQSSKGATVSGESKINIYNGKNIIYSSNSITSSTKSFDFSVDIGDVDELKIEILGNTNLNYFIANPILTK